VLATRQAASDLATAVAAQRAATATASAEIRAATQTAAAQSVEATRQAKTAWAAKIAEYSAIPARELATYPDNHIGEKVKIPGRIFNINGNDELQLYLAGTSDAVYVVMQDRFSDLYEDDVITVYATVDGETCGTNAYGGTVCQPLLVKAFYVK
jgi:hypothetical protein